MTTSRITHTAPGPVHLTLRIGSGRIGVSNETTDRAPATTATVALEAPPATPGATAAAAAVVDHHGATMTVETPAIVTADTAVAASSAGDIAFGPRPVVIAGPLGESATGPGDRAAEFARTVAAGAALPPGSTLNACADGPIIVSGALAHVEALSTRSVYCRDAEHADLATDTGDIIAESVGDLTAVTRIGTITALVDGPATATVAVRGDIIIRAHAAAHITAATAHGHITVYTHVPGVTADLRADRGTVRVVTAY